MATPAVTLRLAVDFGTSNTRAAVRVADDPPQVVVVDGGPLMPSAVYVTADGTLFVGNEADRQAAADPSRYEPHPKRRIDDAELSFGDAVLPVVDVIRAVLRRAVQEARRLAGGAPLDQLVLTHPADWGAARTLKLRRSAHGLAAEVVLVPEPVAAAVFHVQAHAVPDGACLAILDLGGGAADASVVRRAGSGFHTLATRSDPDFGGVYIDQALLAHIGGQVAGADPAGWRRLVEGRELADRRRRRVLRQDIRSAKEALSWQAVADVAVPPPFTDAHLTRDDLERLIAGPVQRAVALLVKAIGDAGQRADQLAGVLLVGGCAQIPMLARLVHARLGVPPVSIDQPETAVARGALAAALLVPQRPATAPPILPAPGGRQGRPGPAARPRFPVRPGPPPWRAAARPPGGTGPAEEPGPADGTAGTAGPGGRAASQPGRGARRPDNAAGRSARRVGHLRRFTVVWVLAAAVLVLAVTGVTIAVARRGDAAQHVAGFHFRFGLPDGWQRTGGDQSLRQVDLGPAEPTGRPDQVVVRELELAYDGGADRERAVAEQAADYERRRAHGEPLSGFDPAAEFAGRTVVHFVETTATDTAADAVTDWYVVLDDRVQVSVGCRHDAAGRQRVLAACEHVVHTLAVTRG